MIYVYTTLFSAFFAWIYDLLRYKNGFAENIVRRIALLISFLTLFIIGAIRYNVGTDYIRYSWYQIPFAISGKDVKFEFFPTMIARFGYWLSGDTNYYYIFAIFHFIIMIFLFLAIIRQSEIVSLSILILMLTTFFPFSLNAMRQAMATSIFLWSLRYLQEKQYKKYILSVIVCSLFHTISLLYLFLIAFDFIKLDRKKTILILAFMGLFSIFGKNVLYRILSSFGIYTEYLNWEVAYSQLHIIYAIVLTLLTNFLLLFVDSENKKKLRAQIYTNYAFTLLAFFIPVLPEGTRLYFLFMPIHILLLPNLYKCSRRKDIAFFTMFVILIFYVFFFYRLIFVGNANQILPYRTIFSK